VLLVKRTSDSRNSPGLWCRPGGAVEQGESPEEACIREVKEEIGIDIEVLEQLDKCRHDEWLAIGFLCRIKSGTPKNLEPHKHDEVKWWPLDNLPELAEYTKTGIEEYYTKYLSENE